jgi:glycosyltransferase A (GT-A) superfamily protein (DUF2064 family)
VKTAPACLVLMFKAPARSKRRMAAAIGDLAEGAAAHLYACASEDLGDWAGPTCLAPAEEADARWLRETARSRPIAAPLVVPQGQGNLGERIENVGHALAARGLDRQIYIGIDCPEMDTRYLRDVDRLLGSHDVVLGPSSDGGVVVMGTRARWPRLATLRWGTDELYRDLEASCLQAGRTICLTGTLRDVDTVEDLLGLTETMAADDRPARRALARWLRGRASKLEQAVAAV